MIVDQLIRSRDRDRSRSFKGDRSSEKPMRSVLKALSWRIIGTLDTLLVAYVLTGAWLLASSIASVDFVTKLILYFVHERVWNTIRWGK